MNILPVTAQGHSGLWVCGSPPMKPWPVCCCFLSLLSELHALPLELSKGKISKAARAPPTGRRLQRERYTGTKTRSLSPGHTPETSETSAVGAGGEGGPLFSRRKVVCESARSARTGCCPLWVMQLTLILGATLSQLGEGRHLREVQPVPCSTQQSTLMGAESPGPPAFA